MVVESATKYWLLAITVIISAHSCNSFAVNGVDALVLGASLTRYQTLVSKNGTFALGFFSSRGTNNCYVGIWYASLSQKTIVWVANRDNPVTKMPGVLEYSTDGNLRLFDGDGLLVWSTEFGQRASRAVIMDSGNFIVLGDAHNESAIVWESFAHPTDTYLPGIKLWKGMALTSWMSSSDPTKWTLKMKIS